MKTSAFERRGLAVRPRGRGSVRLAVLCASTLVAGTVGGLCLFYGGQEDGPPATFRVEARRATPAPTLAGATRRAPPLEPSFVAPILTAGYGPVTFAHAVPLRAGFEPRHAVDAEPLAEVAVIPAQPTETAPAVDALVQTVPLPTPRPALVTATGEPVSGRRRLTLRTVGPSPDRGTVFDRLFRPAQPDGPALAYAAPEDNGFGLFGQPRSAAPDRFTAVYDIAAHTVTLPDGTRLEAHSGLGARLDDPRGVTEHMRGATPPNLYELTPREALFHGVAALRLTPLGGTTYGRAGLLAHTYMLGPRGDSNGCVVFRNYNAFRRAYDSGMIRRLAVVARKL